MKILALIVALGVSAMLGAAQPAVAQTACKSVKMPDGSKTEMCKDASGKWVPAASITPAAPVPSKAEITYQGTYQFTQSKRSGRRGEINFADMLQLDGQRYEGALTLKLNFDGAAVTGMLTGTGGIAGVKLSGLVRDGKCRLTDARALEVVEGACSAEAFNGTLKNTANSRAIVNGKFETSATAVVDVMAKEANAAETARQNAAKREQLRAQCDAGKMTACVEMDQIK